MLRELVAAGVLLIASGVGCFRESGDSSVFAGREFAHELESVLSATRIRRTLDDSSDAALLESETLRILYGRSSENEPYARFVIQDAEFDEDVKRLAVITMQCLPIERYIGFVEFVYKESRSGHCSEAVLADAVFPGEEWGGSLAENYQNHRVAEMLRKILNDAKSSRLRSRVESVLDGDTARFIEHLRATNAQVPDWSCLRAAENMRLKD